MEVIELASCEVVNADAQSHSPLCLGLEARWRDPRWACWNPGWEARQGVRGQSLPLSVMAAFLSPPLPQLLLLITHLSSPLEKPNKIRKRERLILGAQVTLQLSHEAGGRLGSATETYLPEFLRGA